MITEQNALHFHTESHTDTPVYTLTHVRTHISTWTSEACCLPLANGSGRTAAWEGCGAVGGPALPGGVSLAHFAPTPHSPAAQELPLVEKQRRPAAPSSEGKRMVLSGHNFLQDSKVIFVEKAPGIPFLKPASSACCLGAGRGWLKGEGAMHGPRASPHGFEGLWVWGLLHPASRCLFRGSNQLLLVFAFLRNRRPS